MRAKIRVNHVYLLRRYWQVQRRYHCPNSTVVDSTVFLPLQKIGVFGDFRDWIDTYLSKYRVVAALLARVDLGLAAPQTLSFGSLSPTTLAWGFRQLGKVDEVYMNARDYGDIVRYAGPHAPTASSIRGYLWGAQVLVLPSVPPGRIFVCATGFFEDGKLDLGKVAVIVVDRRA